VLVLRAGSVAGCNLIRSLRSGDPSLVTVGCDEEQLLLKRSPADRKYLVPDPVTPAFPPVLRHIVGAERIDVVIPTNDQDVALIARLRPRLSCRTFLPGVRVIDLCQDKYALTAYLRRRGVPVPATYEVTDLERIERLFRTLPRGSTLWCRLRGGTGSMAAIPVRTPVQARAWIEYWQQMRHVPAGMFTLSEYLPGRDLTVQCLMRRGRPVMARMHQKLAYNVYGGGPSGISSTPTIARTLVEPRLLRTTLRAIRALDRLASGAFFIDLREDAAGRARVTEVNAGRFANGPLIQDLVAGADDNIAVTYVRLALGERIQARLPRRGGENFFVLRHLDANPEVYREREMFDGYADASTLARARRMPRSVAQR
jgi:carbamoyl-phosphate synthase large subunit